MCNPFYEDGRLKNYEDLCATHRAEHFGSDGLEGKVGSLEGTYNNNARDY